ncbi:hypothetical protein D1825_00125, partial [Cellulomonas rhizosphaerae]
MLELLSLLHVLLGELGGVAGEVLGALSGREGGRGVGRSLVEGHPVQALGLRQPGPRLGADGTAPGAQEVVGRAQGGLQPADDVVQLIPGTAVTFDGAPGGGEGGVERGLGVRDRAHRGERVGAAGAGGPRILDGGAGG